MHVLHNLLYIIINYISLLVVGGVVAFDEDGAPLLTDEVDLRQCCGFRSKSIFKPDPIQPRKNRSGIQFFTYIMSEE